MAGKSLGRLRKGREFDRVYAEGTVVGGPLFVVRLAANQLSEARWGFAVGKKLAPKSVVRNRVRRRLREAARESGFPGGRDYIVTARPRLLEASFQDVRRQFAMVKARLLSEGTE